MKRRQGFDDPKVHVCSAGQQQWHGNGNVVCGIHAMQPFYKTKPKIKSLKNKKLILLLLDGNEIGGLID